MRDLNFYENKQINPKGHISMTLFKGTYDNGKINGEILKAYEFIRTKNFEVELVIIDEEKHSYENYVREEIEGLIYSTPLKRNARSGNQNTPSLP